MFVVNIIIKRQKMLEILQYDFIQNALIAGVLISIAAGIIGSLVVVNKITFLTGGIAHSSYGGIGLAIYMGIPVLFGATVFAVLTAILIAIITLKNRTRIDAIIGMMWASGMAIGIIFVDLTPGYNVDLMSVLKAFAGKGKILIGHCAAGLLFDFAGITEGKRLAVHPLAKPAVSKGMATDEKSVVDGNFYTAQSENFVWTMMPQVIEALKK